MVPRPEKISPHPSRRRLRARLDRPLHHDGDLVGPGLQGRGPRRPPGPLRGAARGESFFFFFFAVVVDDG